MHTIPHHHPHKLNVSNYWPAFDETLKVESWEHLEQIPTVMVTFIQATFDICPGNNCLYQEYIICYWPNLGQTLKVGSLEHLKQIPIVWWHLSRKHFSISGISQLSLTRFWPNCRSKEGANKNLGFEFLFCSYLSFYTLNFKILVPSPHNVPPIMWG